MDYFNLSVCKNLSFDRNQMPFKFEFDANEPEESQTSAFEITPKLYTIGPKEIVPFTVTFYSDKGVGDFKSLVLATPSLSTEELEVASDG